MQSISVDSIGKRVYVAFGEDVSSYTTFMLHFEPKLSGANDFEKAGTLGVSDVEAGGVKYLANEYVYYDTEDDIFQDHPGIWRVKATATKSGGQVSTRYILLRVVV